MSRSTKAVISCLQKIVAALFVLFVIWFSSLYIYDREKMQDAQRERNYLLRGVTPYQWDFSWRTELDGGHGIDKFEWQHGVLKGDTEDPYFYLNLQGRYIDAVRYDLIRLRLHSDKNSKLRIFHHQLRDDQIHASELIEVKPGWQIIEINLAEISWELNRLEQPGQENSQSAWGGEAVPISALRIDPVLTGSFALDWIELDSSSGFADYADQIYTFKNLDDEVFQHMRSQGGQGWMLAQDNWMRTPESARWQRMQIAREFPSVVVFPRMPGAAELEGQTRIRHGVPWLLPAILYGTAMVLFLLRAKFNRAWRPACEIIVVVLFFEGFVFWNSQLSAAFQMLILLPILYVFWTLRPKSMKNEIFGDKKAWLLLSPLLILPLVALLIYLPVHQREGLLLSTLGIYLFTALAQQYVIATLLLQRFQSIHPGYAVLLTTTVFGFLHFPNFVLMVGTFLLGIIWLEVYQKHKNLLAIAASHALLAVSFTLLAPPWLRLSGSVGRAFLATL